MWALNEERHQSRRTYLFFSNMYLIFKQRRFLSSPIFVWLRSNTSSWWTDGVARREVDTRRGQPFCTPCFQPALFNEGTCWRPRLLNCKKNYIARCFRLSAAAVSRSSRVPRSWIASSVNFARNSSPNSWQSIFMSSAFAATLNLIT